MSALAIGVLAQQHGAENDGIGDGNAEPVRRGQGQRRVMRQRDQDCRVKCQSGPEAFRPAEGKEAGVLGIIGLEQEAHVGLTPS